MIESHLPLVEHLVLRISRAFPRHVDRSELVSAGMVGLVEAALRFDEDRGVPFARFAARRIRGAVLDVVRNADWASRSVRQLSRQADAASQAFTARTGRTPTDVELASQLDVSPEQLVSMRERVRHGVLRSFDAHDAEDDSGAPSERFCDRSASTTEEVVEQQELHGYLRSALAHLPERHRIVVIGHYFEQRSFEELAQFLGVTPSRVSQLRADAVEMIRDGLEAQYSPRSEERPVGRVAIRRARFASAIARHSDWRTRLDATARSEEAMRARGFEGARQTMASSWESA